MAGNTVRFHPRSNAAPIQIDKSVPVPTIIGGRTNRKYPVQEMDVGDSFLMPKDVSHQRAYALAHHSTHQSGGTKKFVAKQTPEGMRVWRVA